MKKKKEHKCEAVPAGTAVRGHGVNDRKPVSERARIRGAGEDVSRMPFVASFLFFPDPFYWVRFCF